MGVKGRGLLARPAPTGGQVRSFLDRRIALRSRRWTMRGADVMRSNAEAFWHQAKVRKLCPLSAALWPALVSRPKDGQWLCQPRDPDFARLPAPQTTSRCTFQSWYAFVCSACMIAVCWAVEEKVARKNYSKPKSKVSTDRPSKNEDLAT